MRRWCRKKPLVAFLHLAPCDWVAKLSNARDMSQQGHWGTGDVEVALATQADLDAAKAAILAAYEGKPVSVP